MAIQEAKIQLSKTSAVLIKVATVIGAITVIAGGYSFFINNIWKPKVTVDSVDFDNGFATLSLPFGKEINIYGDGEFLIGGDWGVQFGTTKKNGATTYERIELTKKGMVVDYLKTPTT